MDIMFADNVGFGIGLSCELIFVESLCLYNVGLNSFLSHKTNTVFNAATVFVGSYFFDTACAVDHDSTITKTKIPMTVIFTFLFDGNFMGADYIYNMLSLVDNIRMSLNNAFLYGFIMHTTAIEERHLSGIDCNRCSTIYNVSTLVGLISLISLVDNIRMSSNDAFLYGFIMHLHHATAIEERHLVDNIRMSLIDAFLYGFIMHLHHATAIEERYLSGIDCDRYSAVCNVSTLVGMKTKQYNLGEYSILLTQESRNSPLKMEEIMSSTLLLCSRKSLNLRPIILGEKFCSTRARIAVIFISNFYFIPFVLSHQQYLLIFTHRHL